MDKVFSHRVKRFPRVLVAVLLLLVGIAGVKLWRWLGLEHRYDGVILRAARFYGVDPALVKAVVWQESRFDRAAVGRAGEVGLMQVTEIAGREWASSSGVENFSPNSLFNPLTNTMAGAFYLARAVKRYAATEDPAPYALAEYNAGRSRVLRWMRYGGQTNRELFLAHVDIASTRNYISEVLTRRQHYRAHF